jgi:hypothetical protein
VNTGAGGGGLGGVGGGALVVGTRGTGSGGRAVADSEGGGGVGGMGEGAAGG